VCVAGAGLCRRGEAGECFAAAFSVSGEARRRARRRPASLWGARVCPERKEGPMQDGSLMRCCAEDEGSWPFGVALRREASNHLMLRWLKTVVVSDEEKAS